MAMSSVIMPMRHASWMLTLLPLAGSTIPPVHAWASSSLWAVMESTSSRFNASVTDIFSTLSVSKMAPMGSCSPTISTGEDRVKDTLDICLWESGESCETLLSVALRSVTVVVFVVVILARVGDKGLDTSEDDREDDVDKEGTEASDVLKFDDEDVLVVVDDDVTEDIPKGVLEVVDDDDDFTEDVPKAAGCPNDELCLVLLVMISANSLMVMARARY